MESVFLTEENIIKASGNIEQELKPISKTLCIRKAERCEVRVIYYNKFYKSAEDEIPIHTQWYVNGKDVVVYGHEDSHVGNFHCVSCFGQYQPIKEWIQCPGFCPQWFHE